MNNFEGKTKPASLIKQIKTLLTIDEVIKYYINIKKKGKYYVCCCPFHKERTPSFFINSACGFYKCFGCGEAGDVFSFVEKYENVSFVETLYIFLERYKEVSSLCQSLIIQKKENLDVFEKKRKGCEILKKIQGYFSASLLSKSSSKAWDFLKKRGIDVDIVRNFGIGFCESGSSFFLENRFSSEDLVLLKELGIVHGDDLQKEKVAFSERISFPFFDSFGNVVGFSWRRLLDDISRNNVGNVAKYVNSAESFLFKKREILFGFFQARDKIKETRKCFIVEGFFDVIAMFYSGIENVVGVSGTALSQEQCSILKRHVDCISLFFDNDKAGEMATLRCLEVCLKEGFMVNVVRVKGKEKDPDEFLRVNGAGRNVEEVEKIEEDFVSFLFRIFLDEKDGIHGKMRAVNKVRSFLSFISDPVYRTLAVRKLSSLCGVPVSVLSGGAVPSCKDGEKKRRDISTIEEYEEEILFLLFKILFSWQEKYKEELDGILKEIEERFSLSEENKGMMDTFLKYFKDNGKLEADVLTNIKDCPLKKRIISVFFNGDIVDECGDCPKCVFDGSGELSSLLKVFSENVFFFKIKRIQAFIAEKKEILKHCGGDDANKIIDEIDKLKAEERRISQYLNIRIF